MKVPISVIIPCFNAERFVRDAIASAQAQTYPVDEIIVVDNNCTDKTVEIAEEMGAIVVKQPIQGLARARNKGIGIAKNEWIALLDSDDIWLEDKIEFQWKAAQKFPGARLLSCHTKCFLSRRKDPPDWLDLRAKTRPETYDREKVVIDDIFNYASKIYAGLHSWFAINASTAMIHRGVFERVGIFDENLAFREEIEFFMRALSFAPIATVSKTLALIRLHRYSMGQNFAGLMNGHNTVIKRMQRFPDNYVAGAVEYNQQVFTTTFLEYGAMLNNMNQRTNTKSD